MAEPLKCWCGNEPSYSISHADWSIYDIQMYGCHNHPRKNTSKMKVVVKHWYNPKEENPISEDELIEAWNEKVRNHNKISQRKKQNCPNCGERYQKKWNFCPSCGRRLN